MGGGAFVLSGGGLALFVVFGLLDLETLDTTVRGAARSATDALGLFWQVLAVVSFVTGLLLALSSTGAIRLGRADRPSTPFVPWLATIFCTLIAGGGVFWSAAEPLYHFLSPPPVFAQVVGGTQDAVAPALAQSFFHWGFLAWALTAGLGALILLSESERGHPILPRTLLAPLIGRWAHRGPLAAAVDGVSIFAAAAGTIGPIGFLAIQLAKAAERFLGIPDVPLTQVVGVGLLTVVASISAARGIDRGIQVLSQWNVRLILLAALLLMVLGPLEQLAHGLVMGHWTSLRWFSSMAFFRGNADWLSSWTIFYWGWFLGYGPIMSVFVARISKGRSVRTIILSITLLAPLLMAAWFALLGGTAIVQELRSPGSLSEPLQQHGLGEALFALLDSLPYAVPLQILFVALVFLFLVTSEDSIAYGFAMVAARSEEPPKSLRVLMSVLMGASAALLLCAGPNAIESLQSFIVVAAVPVSFVMATLPVSTAVIFRGREAGVDGALQR